MSYNFRTPSEQALACLTSQLTEKIYSNSANSIKETEDNIGSFFNFYMGSEKKEFCSSNGIYLSPIPFLSHSHPLCKTIENHLLYVVIPSLIKDLSSLNVVSMKQAKLKIIKSLVKDRSLNFKLFNRLFDVKDTFRYGEIDDKASVKQFPGAVLKRHMRKDPLLDIKIDKGEIFLFHDEFHYWTIDSLIDFLEVFEPEVILATVVYPVELLEGAKTSMLPLAYEFEILGDKFQFAPDGNFAEAYEQPLDLGWLFKAREIVAGDQTYTVDVISTIGAHHLFSIVKGRRESRGTRFFKHFDVVDMSPFSNMGYKIPVPSVRYSFFKKIVIYLMSLKKPDSQSAIAKLRQLVGDEICLREILFFDDFAHRFSTHGYTSLSTEAIMDILYESIKSVIPDFALRFLNGYQRDKVLKQVANVSNFFVKVETTSICRGYKFNFKKALLNLIKRDKEVGKGLSIDIRMFRPMERGEDISNRDRSSIVSFNGTDWSMVKRPNYVTENSDGMNVVVPIYDNLTEYIGVRKTRVVLQSSLSKEEQLDHIKKIDNEIKRYRNRFIGGSKLPRFKNGYFMTPLSSTELYGYAQERICWREWDQSEEGDVDKLIEDEIKLMSENSEIANGLYASEKELDGLIDQQIDLNDDDTSSIATEHFATEIGTSDDSDIEKLTKVNSKTGINSGVRGEFKELIKIFNHMDVSQQLKDELKRELERNEGKKIRSSRRAYFFCSDATFDYGHDKHHYENLGWPSSISTFVDIASRLTGFQFNSVLVNSYKRGGSISWHADDEHVYNIDDNPVLTYSLSGNCVFSIKKGKQQESLNMGAGAAILMERGAQKVMLHSVKCTTERISLTFRSQRRSFSMPFDTSKVDKAINEINLDSLKNLCFYESLAASIPMNLTCLIKRICSKDSSFVEKIVKDEGVSIGEVSKIANLMGIKIDVLMNGEWLHIGFPDSKFKKIYIEANGRHFNVYDPRNLGTGKSERDTPKRKKVNIQSSDLFERVVNLVDPGKQFVNRFERDVDFGRVANLIKSLLTGNTGVITNDTFNGGSSIFKGGNNSVGVESLSDPKFLEKEVGGDITYRGALIIGFAGSGKSRPVQMAIDSLDTSIGILVISPRVRLLEDWRLKLGNKRKNIRLKTFESALRENFSNFGLIVIDEVSLLPRGYSDLIAFKIRMDDSTYREGKRNCKLLILGDPCQADYYNRDDNSILSKGNEFSCFDIEFPKYLMYSFRLGKGFSDLFKINLLGESTEKNEIKVYASIEAAAQNEKYDAILVPGRVEKELFPNVDEVMTFGESQGLTFDSVGIVLSENTLLTSENQILVALTRARKRVFFIKYCNYDLNEFVKRAEGKLIWKFLTEKGITEKTLCSLMGMGDVDLIKEPIKYGNSESEERCQGDPWMKTMMSLVQEDEAIEEEVIEDEAIEPSSKVHLPLVGQNYSLMVINEKIRAREYREAKMDGKWSSQFRDKEVLNEYSSSIAPVNYEAIFPRHTSFDDVTFMMAVKKRLEFSNPMVERAKLEKNWIKGKILFDEFKTIINFNDVFRPDLLDKSRKEFERVRMLKSKKMIEVHANRSDPDWNIKKFLLFMKSQLCKKNEKAFCDAKAGQTLACFSHMVLFKFSTWTRYAEEKINEALPDSFYIHSRKNFDKMEKWVKKNYIGPVCVESDYESFDASQDSSILAFEVHLLRAIGWPEGLVSDYIDLKLDLGCKLGTLAIMRFTGEFGTFFFNTMANMAFTFCRYCVNRRTPICFAGDDMCILANVGLRNDKSELLDSLKLKAKVERKKNPIFCGWILSRHGILKLPSLVHYRLEIAKEWKTLEKVIDSYTIEASYAYKKSAHIYELLDEEQMNYHQLVIRFLVKKKHLMKGSSAEIFSDIINCNSDGV